MNPHGVRCPIAITVAITARITPIRRNAVGAPLTAWREVASDTDLSLIHLRLPEDLIATCRRQRSPSRRSLTRRGKSRG
jgi:hypothetical protein